MTLHPAAPDSGIVFRRSDAGAEIRAYWRNSVESALSTVLSNREGVHVATVEHLLAALAGNRIDKGLVPGLKSAEKIEGGSFPRFCPKTF